MIINAQFILLMILFTLILTFGGISILVVLLNFESNINRIKLLNKKKILVRLVLASGCEEEFVTDAGETISFERNVGTKKNKVFKKYTFRLNSKRIKYKGRIPVAYVLESQIENFSPDSNDIIKEFENNEILPSESLINKLTPVIFSNMLAETKSKGMVPEELNEDKLLKIQQYALGALIASAAAAAKVFGFI